MSHKTFSISILAEFYNSLKDEADKQFRSLNQQINLILKERYNAHAPPVTATRSSKSRNGQNKTNGRKTKAEVN